MDEISRIWPGWQIVKTLKECADGSTYMIGKKTAEKTEYAVAEVLYYPDDTSGMETLSTAGMYVPSIQNKYKEKLQEIENKIQKIKNLRARHVVPIEEYKVLENKNTFGWIIYIRMKMLKSLDEYIKARGGLSEEETAKLGMDICSALKGCEKNHIIHGDIKMANIYVTHYGSFQLGNFEILRQREGIVDIQALGSMLCEMRNNGLINANGELLEILKRASCGHWYTHAADMEKDLKEWKQKKMEEARQKAAVEKQEPSKPELPKTDPPKVEPKKTEPPKVNTQNTVPLKSSKKKGSGFWKILICLGIALVIGRQINVPKEKSAEEQWSKVYEKLMDTLSESEYDFSNLNCDSYNEFLLEQGFVFENEQSLYEKNIVPNSISEDGNQYRACTEEEVLKSGKAWKPEVCIDDYSQGASVLSFYWGPEESSKTYQKACPLIKNYNDFSGFCEEFGITEEMLENLEDSGNGFYDYDGESVYVSYDKPNDEYNYRWISLNNVDSGENAFIIISFSYFEEGNFSMSIYCD